MKKLIFPLILISLNLLAKDQEGNELPQHELDKKMISYVKELEVQTNIEQSQQFKECRAQNPFVPGKDIDESKATAAVECFKKKLQNKNAEDLKKLSEALALESYGLVKSKQTKEITSFLGDQMYKKMTGVDPQEKDVKKKLQDMKFGKQKLIDQKVFIHLYKTQLIKNALFEVSRFCLEDLRIEGKKIDGKSFNDYWNSSDGQAALNGDSSKVTDLADEKFASLEGVDLKSNQAIQEALIKDIGGNSDNFAFMEKFFGTCSKFMVPLCDQFKKNQEGIGANACLSLDRLRKIRTGISKSEKVAAEFDKMDGGTFAIKLNELTSPQFYDLNSTGEDSPDKLTSHSSGDILKAQVIDDDLEKKRDECLKAPSGPDCDRFIIIDDSRAKLEASVDMEYRLKREVEVARVKELNAKDLETYLTENGYLDLLEKMKAGNLDADGISKEIENIFEAKRLAARQEIQNKLGKRQMSETESKEGIKKEKAIGENIKESKEERARLAQVVMFNNVITGFLQLQNKDGKELGRNVNALKGETQALKDSKINQDLFKNLQDNQQGSGAKGLFENTRFIDTILGASEEETKSTSPK